MDVNLEFRPPEIDGSVRLAFFTQPERDPIQRSQAGLSRTNPEVRLFVGQTLANVDGPEHHAMTQAIEV